MLGRWQTTKLKKNGTSGDTPAEFRLEQNVPNPFRTQTTIRFSVPRRSSIRLVIYNSREERVCVLHEGPVAPGSYSLDWNGTDANKQHLKNGNYVYRLEGEGFVASRRLIIKDR